MTTPEPVVAAAASTADPEPAQSLSGSVALITGGASGIGLATARVLVARGATVVLAGRDEARGAQAVQQLLEAGGHAVFHRCDVAAASAVEQLVAFVVECFGRLDCAVNSAAHESKPGAMHELPVDEAGQTMAVDVLGVFHCMKYEIDAMLRSGGGTIVNVASVNGLSGTPGAAVYSAAKHAVVGLTRSTAREYIGRGIRINAVCPGATDTPRRRRRAAGLSPQQQAEQQQALDRAIPIGRLARADEIAEAIVWLASPQSSYVVGHCLVVDGGLHA